MHLHGSSQPNGKAKNGEIFFFFNFLPCVQKKKIRVNKILLGDATELASSSA